MGVKGGIRFKALGLALFVLFLAGCGGKEGEKVERVRLKARTLKIEARKVPLVRVFPGRVESKGELTLASKVAGFVKEVKVEEGQKVNKGQLLLSLDDRDIRDRIRALEEAGRALERQKAALASRLAYARANYQRYSQLLKEDAVTQEEFDKVRSQYQALAQEERALEFRIKETASQARALAQTLRYTVIRAPHEGVVTSRMVDPGTYVNPGTPLLKLVSLGAGYWFVARVDEAYLDQVKKGEGVFLHIGPLELSTKARLDLVVPRVDPGTGTFKVKVDVSSLPVKAGMFGRLYLVVARATRVLVPWRAVITRGNLRAVYTVDPERVVHFRIIRTGKTYRKVQGDWMPVEVSQGANLKDLWVEVLGGLDPGETIVVSRLDQVREGAILEP